MCLRIKVWKDTEWHLLERANENIQVLVLLEECLLLKWPTKCSTDHCQSVSTGIASLLFLSLSLFTESSSTIMSRSLPCVYRRFKYECHWLFNLVILIKLLLCFTEIRFSHPHNISLRYILSWCSFYTWGYWVIERLGNLCKVTVRNGARIWNQGAAQAMFLITALL